MNDSELQLATNTLSEHQNDWDVETITEQIWSDLNGAVNRSVIQEMLLEVIPGYENVRIRTYVPIFIRRDAIKRLRATRAPIASPGINEADASTESRTNSDPSSSRNAYDEQEETIGTGLIHWKPAT